MGGPWINDQSGNDSPYQYTGKELENFGGLGWYDYGARYYDPSVGRWTSVDPLAGKYPNMSPYVYTANSPMINIDPDGRDWYRHDETNAVIWREGSGSHEGYSNLGATYSENFEGGFSITYTQNEVSSMTWNVLETDQFVSMYDQEGNYLMNCYQAACQTLINAGFQSAGRSSEVLMTDIGDNGRSGTTSTSAVAGITVINNNVEGGKPLVVGVDYQDDSPNHDGMTDHFIVISGKTETYTNGSLSSTTYRFFDNRTRNSNTGTQLSNNFSCSDNRLTGSYTTTNGSGRRQTTSSLNYTVTTVRRNRN